MTSLDSLRPLLKCLACPPAIVVLAVAQLAEAQQSPQLVWTNTGTTLEFSWTGSWNLQSQTNALGIGSNWFDYPGGGTSPVSVPIDAQNQAVVFRLANKPITNCSCPITHLVISQVQSRGAGGSSDEFVELYNPTIADVSLDVTWKLEARSSMATTYASRWTGTGKAIPAHGHFLIAGSAYSGAVMPDELLSSGITDASSLRLLQASAVVDSLCYGYDAGSTLPYATDPTFTCEGTPVGNNPHNNTAGTNTNGSIERKPGGSSGNCTDTGDNAADFLILPVSNPQNSMSPPACS